MIEQEFARVAGGYTMTIAAIATRFEADQLTWSRGALSGLLTIRTSLPGARTYDGDALLVTRHAVTDAKNRTEIARGLEPRVPMPVGSELDWFGFLEAFDQQILAAEREGEPAVFLRDLPRPTGVRYLPGAAPFLLTDHPVIFFGDGGDLKSYVLLHLATEASRAGARILWADFEFSAEDNRDRLERLCGSAMPDVLYVRCDRPLSAEVARLQRIARDHERDYMVVDSAAFASDGPPEAAEVAAGFFRSLRQIGLGSAIVAHMTKAENGDQKPFGSAFWHNGARATWHVKKSTPGAVERPTIGLFNRKTNLGPPLSPVGFEFTFDDDARSTSVRRVDVADVAELAERMPLRQRMTSLLRGGAMTMAQIAAELDVPVDSIVKTSKRGEGKVFVRVAGSDGIYRIGLLERIAS